MPNGNCDHCGNTTWVGRCGCQGSLQAEIAALKEEVRRAKIEAYQEALEVLRVHDRPAAQAIISDKLKQEVQ